MLRDEFRKIRERALFSINRFYPGYRQVIWLIGDGRSGTTWVADLINSHHGFRELFEPFHPMLVSEMSFLKPHLYMRTDDENWQLYAMGKSVFSGRFFHERVNESNDARLFRGLLIKDIFANLFAAWAGSVFSHIKTVLLVRNPFAMALSKFKKRNWLWMNEPLDFLSDPKLMNDFLLPFSEYIQKIDAIDDFILKQILIWSIIHFVPFHQLHSDRVCVTFYENILSNPSKEISRIMGYVYNDPDYSVSLSDTVISKPSRKAIGESNILNGSCPVTSWKKEISPFQFEKGLEILETFGLEKMYNFHDDYPMPFAATIGNITF